MTMFISFEGIDGSGKTSQIKAISRFFTALNIDNLQTSEPRCAGIKWAEEIVNIIINEKIDVKSQLCLINALRGEHIAKIIKPALENKIVFSDRFVDSTVCYQGYGFGHDIQKIKALHSQLHENFMPSVTYLLDISVENAQFRIKLRGNENKFDKIDIKTLENIRNGFLKEADLSLGRIVVIDASKSQEEISKEIINDLRSKML